MFEDKNLRDIFDNANLDKENWLEPSDTVLQNIEAEIYKKKKNKWFWFLMPAMLLLLGGIAITYYANLNDVSIQENTTTDVKTVKKNTIKEDTPKAAQTKQTSNKKLEADKKNLDKIVDKSSIDKIQKTITQSEDKVAFSTQKEIQNKKIDNTKSKQGIDKKSTNNKQLQSIDKIASRNSNSSIPLTRMPGIEKNTPVIQNENNLNQQKPSIRTQVDQSIFEKAVSKITIPSNSKSIVEKRTLIEKKFMATQRLRLKQTNLSNYLLSAKLTNSKNTFSPIQNKNIEYEFATGFSWWRFNLNQAFSKALKPADFTHSTGKGFFVSTGIRKAINRKITLEGNLQYEQVVFKSGHKTNLLYSGEEETAEMTTNFDIKIASPIGFSDSNIGIKRTVPNLNQPINLFIDLESSHQVFNVDAGVNLSAQFIEFIKLNGVVILGTGINQVLAIRNQLSSFTTKNPQFEALDNTALSQQIGLNKTRPYFSIGLRLNYIIKANRILQFQYHFKQDLLPLYKEDAFKSSLSRQQLGFGYLMRF